MKSVGLLAVGFSDLHLHMEFLQRQVRQVSVLINGVPTAASEASISTHKCENERNATKLLFRAVKMYLCYGDFVNNFGNDDFIIDFVIDLYSNPNIKIRLQN